MSKHIKLLIETIFTDDIFNNDDNILSDLNVDKHFHNYKYFPKDYFELKDIVALHIKENGNNCDLNDIDVSHIISMYALFSWFPEFNGDISNWDVSNVLNMCLMFCDTEFNGDISLWDVSNVDDMSKMFLDSRFNSDISQWNVSNVTTMKYMFRFSQFNNDISNWKLNNECSLYHTFAYSPLENDIKKQCHNSHIIKESIFTDDIFNDDTNSILSELNVDSHMKQTPVMKLKDILLQKFNLFADISIEKKKNVVMEFCNNSSEQVKFLFTVYGSKSIYLDSFKRHGTKWLQNNKISMHFTYIEQCVGWVDDYLCKHFS